MEGVTFKILNRGIETKEMLCIKKGDTFQVYLGNYIQNTISGNDTFLATSDIYIKDNKYAIDFEATVWE